MPEVLVLSGLQAQQRETATREALVRGELLIHGGRLTLPGLVGEPWQLRREGAGYVVIEAVQQRAVHNCPARSRRSRVACMVRLALTTDILEQLGLSAGRYGYFVDACGTQRRYDLARRITPRAPCMWEIYLRTRQAVREAMAPPESF